MTSDASFDDVIATTFTPGAKTTLPILVFGAIRVGQQLPEVKAVVSFVVVALIVIPVAIAARLTGCGGLTRPTVGSSGNERYAAATSAANETVAAVDRS